MVENNRGGYKWTKTVEPEQRRLRRRRARMGNVVELFPSADWPTERPQPALAAPEPVAPGERFQVTVAVGKNIVPAGWPGFHPDLDAA